MVTNKDIKSTLVKEAHTKLSEYTTAISQVNKDIRNLNVRDLEYYLNDIACLRQILDQIPQLKIGELYTKTQGA